MIVVAVAVALFATSAWPFWRFWGEAGVRALAASGALATTLFLVSHVLAWVARSRSDRFQYGVLLFGFLGRLVLAMGGLWALVTWTDLPVNGLAIGLACFYLTLLFVEAWRRTR